jgi:glycosyltransferase involved in cell wall biosynthesis
MKKKILMTAANLFPPKGGAERSLLAFAEKMAKDFDITIIGPGDGNFEKREKGYALISKKRPFYFMFLKSFLKINVQNLWWRKVLKEHLIKNNYDLIISQGILIPSLNEIKLRKLLFVRGLTFFNTDTPINPFEHKYDWYKYLPFIFKIQYPLVRIFQKKGLKVLKKADILISNSNFIRMVTKFYTGRDSEIIYPPIKKEDYELKSHKREYILFITPSVFKGVDIMYDIAKNLSDKKFLVVGKPDKMEDKKRYFKRLIKLSNVKLLNYLKDMRRAYEKTRLLISPVKWYEPFGRTPAEAMVNGIPAIVSNRGGLPEVVGNSGDIIGNRNNLKEWVDKIRKYDDNDYYSKKSKLCGQRYKKFSLENQYKKLKKIIGGVKI